MKRGEKMYTIYLVEDEMNLNQVLTSYLEQEGWGVCSFTDGVEARKAVKSPPHLWILDIMLPGVDGYQLIREIKAETADMPVIFISARDADIDRVVGLELGSDDYLAKPFLPRELVIRSRKLLERVYARGAEAARPQGKSVITVAPYTIDEQGRMVKDAFDMPLELTSKEFDLLVYFAAHAGQLMEREQVLRRVWGEDYFGTDRVVDDLVRRLRKKLPELRLETVYGYGYRLVN